MFFTVISDVVYGHKTSIFSSANTKSLVQLNTITKTEFAAHIFYRKSNMNSNSNKLCYKILA